MDPSSVADLPTVTFSDFMSASTLPLISIVEAFDILPLKIAPFPMID